MRANSKKCLSLLNYFGWYQVSLIKALKFSKFVYNTFFVLLFCLITILIAHKLNEKVTLFILKVDKNAKREHKSWFAIKYAINLKLTSDLFSQIVIKAV